MLISLHDVVFELLLFVLVGVIFWVFLAFCFLGLNRVCVSGELVEFF